MPGFDPELDTTQSAEECVRADLQFANVEAAFDHAVRADLLRGGVQELSQADLRQLIIFGQFSFASPAFAKLVVNAGRQLLARGHEAMASSLQARDY